MTPTPETPAPEAARADGPHFVVVGIGADGWDGLTPPARRALESATVIHGSRRQLDMLDGPAGRRVPWTSPMSEHLAALLDSTTASAGSSTVHVLASGDPMFHGIGSTIVGAVGAHRVTVIPQVSSASLACARLGWDLARTVIVSAVTADPEIVLTEITDGRRLLVLSRDAATPARVADMLADNGFGASGMVVLEQLGGPAERVTSGTVDGWDRAAIVDALNIIALACVGPHRSTLPGRADDAFDHDGQITKSAVRALTVCALAPSARQVLWDIGSGSGSVGIEWLRAAPGVRVVAFEKDPDRAERIAANARHHGVAERVDIRGAAPDALRTAAPPDAVFIGGGLTRDILESAWAALPPGGRLVVNAVTIENQTLMIDWHRDHPGVLRRIGIETAAPLGGFSAWRPALPIVQWFGDTPAGQGSR
ncbi:precorrin-6y C5,15-methyltransferase (decarboxylating) subunit CbiE [Gordonia sp. VNQ95]|uniref:precorrin-6y C5,15-methyltransferase (decarboxylating) subunit CbiE n=1 Tax=Gordonia TaxID=2053 RepID=UPI0032B416CE